MHSNKKNVFLRAGHIPRIRRHALVVGVGKQELDLTARTIPNLHMLHILYGMHHLRSINSLQYLSTLLRNSETKYSSKCLPGSLPEDNITTELCSALLPICRNLPNQLVFQEVI